MSRFRAKNLIKRTFSTLVLSSTTLLGIGALSPAIAREAEASIVAQNRFITATSAQNSTLYLNNDRSYSYNLEVVSGGRFSGLNVPAGATIVGQYVPAEGGLRYNANAVVINGRTYNIDGVSRVIEDVKDPRDTDVGSVAEDSAIGAAGGLVIGEILGDADVGEAVGGAVAGGVVGNVTADRVVVVEPDRPITLYTR